jgi:endoglucanase
MKFQENSSMGLHFKNQATQTLRNLFGPIFIFSLIMVLSWQTGHEMMFNHASLQSSGREISLAVSKPTSMPTPSVSPGENPLSLVYFDQQAEHLPTVTPLPTPTPIPVQTPQPVTASRPKPIARTIAAPANVASLQKSPANTLFYNEQSLALAAHIASIKSVRPDDAANLSVIASQPQAKWFGNWNGALAHDVKDYVSAAAQNKSIPVLVTYNIPYRDCNGYSAGGANSDEAYLDWIGTIAQNIRGYAAWVILEPDSLSLMDCLQPRQQVARMSLLQKASALLIQNGASVYLDAGHAGWIPADRMADRLVQAGIGAVQGFSLNVSNFIATADSTAYGQAISHLVGGKHFVIDTSRNGNGPTSDFQWCNPTGRAIGHKPTMSTGNPLIDGYLWVKHPGESDGTCNGGPNAGTLWPEYALTLVQNASR